MKFAHKMICLLVLVLSASFGLGGCWLLYSDFAVQRRTVLTADAALHSQICTDVQTDLLDRQRRGLEMGGAVAAARLALHQQPAALWQGDRLVDYGEKDSQMNHSRTLLPVVQQLLEKLPFTQNVDLSAIGTAIQDFLTNFVSSSDSATLGAIGEFAKSLPDTIVGIVVGLLAAYFFIADKDKLITGVEKHLSAGFLAKTERIYKQLVHAVGGYFKAQFKIMGVIYVILLIGLLILRVDFAWLIAFGIAFLDMLPVFGTGTVLCPWAVIKLFTGDYKMAVGMIVLYVVSLVVHQIVQPKLIGDSVGLDPFASLLFMFIGYRVGSVVGMILAIPIGMILINLYEAGAFDTLVWCVREVVNDFNNFRKVGGEKK